MEENTELVDIIVELTSFLEASRTLREYIGSLEKTHIHAIDDGGFEPLFDANEAFVKRGINALLNYKKKNKKKHKKKIKRNDIE